MRKNIGNFGPICDYGLISLFLFLTPSSYLYLSHPLSLFCNQMHWFPQIILIFVIPNLAPIFNLNSIWFIRKMKYFYAPNESLEDASKYMWEYEIDAQVQNLEFVASHL